MFYTTLNRIRKCQPCRGGWEQLLKHLGKTKADDEPLPLLAILELNGLDDAIWALRAIDDCPEIRLFAVRCARQVQHLLADQRSIDALDTAERYAIGEATKEELTVARAATWDTARDTARAVAWVAARKAAEGAADAAWDTAWDTASAVALAVAWSAARKAVEGAADAAWDTASAVDAAWDTAWEARADMTEVQCQDFIDIFCSP